MAASGYLGAAGTVLRARGAAGAASAWRALDFGIGFVKDLVQKLLLPLGVQQFFDNREALKSVLAVEDARDIRLLRLMRGRGCGGQSGG